MDYAEAIEFIKEAKQPPAYFDHNGDRYRFVIHRKGETCRVKDPCSYHQDCYFKWSKIYNHSLFKYEKENF